MLQLLAAARHEARRRLDRQLRVLGHLLARLVVATDETGKHQSLCLRARLGETALDEEDVEAFLRHGLGLAGRDDAVLVREDDRLHAVA